MRVNRGLLGWGVFFIALGAVPIAVRGGVVGAGTASQAWQLWPMLLIGAGLALALRNTGWAAVGNVVVGLAFGLMAGGVVAGGVSPGAPLSVCGVPGTASAGPNGAPVTGTLAPEASVRLAADCGTLNVTTAAGSGWSIAWPAEGVTAPDIGSPDGANLDAEFGQRHGFAVGEPAARWDVVLPEDPSINLSLEVGAGSLRAALGSAHVASVDAAVNGADARLDLGGAIGTRSVSGSVNAGSLRVTLPTPSDGLSGTFAANVGSVSICAPSGVPLRITVDGEALGSVNFGQRGMAQDGSIWTRGAWASSPSRLDLHVSVNLGSITLDPENGCG